MSKVIVVTAGHNVYNNSIFDPGATSFPDVEADINKETAKKLVPLLRNKGYKVHDVTPYNEKFYSSKGVPAKKKHHIERCKRVDKLKADLYIDIHINAGGGTGVEIWLHNNKSKSVPHAEKILKNISNDIGIPNRGIKYKPGFWSVSLTKRPAMIVEGCFIDNKSDIAKLTPEKYAQAIAKSFDTVVGAEPLQTKPPKETIVKSTKSKTWRKYINGNEVRNLQIELNKQFKKNVKVDGFFGNEMERRTTVNVRRGAKGNMTRIIQRRLIAKGYKLSHGVDSSFGPDTQRQVRSFQTQNKLSTDGIVGKLTWRALFKK